MVGIQELAMDILVGVGTQVEVGILAGVVELHQSGSGVEELIQWGKVDREPEGETCVVSMLYLIFDKSFWSIYFRFVF